MQADLLRRSWHLAGLAALGLAVALWLGARAELPPPVYFLHDQQHYLAMADPLTQPPADPRAAPFSWRLLPSALVRASGLPAADGFHVLTLVALALIPPATAVMLSAAGASAAAAVGLGAAVALGPAVSGYLSWDFIRPDGLSLLLIVISAWAVIRERPAVFVASLLALSLTKETWLVSAVFALVWSRAHRRVFWKWAVAGTVLAFAVAATVRLALPPAQDYSLVAVVRELYWPLELRTIGRRALLATASTWNVLTPLVAFALASRIREPRAWAVVLPILVASAQILVAIDTQRLVAAAYPFVLLACAWEVDRLPVRRRVVAGLLIAVAQVPWLLTYARVWTLPVRGVEVILVVTALYAALLGLRLPSIEDRGSRSAAGSA